MSGTSIGEKIYGLLPVPLQHLACSCYGWQMKRFRYNTVFREKFGELLKSEFYSASEIEAYQNDRLRKLIRYAYENVPYYRRKMHELRLVPNDIRRVADLPKMPVLTKEDVRLHRDELVSAAVKKRELYFSHTSGTTGKSLQFYLAKHQIPFQWAVWWRHRHRFGVAPFSWHVNYTGKIVVPCSQNRPPFWRWNYPLRQLIIPMQQVIPEKICDFVDLLNRASHPFIYFGGYPSVMHSFAVCAMEKQLLLNNRPKFIFPGAEKVLDYQRRDIEAFTGATITDQYGFSEACGNASQCPEFAYHEDFEFGILECANPNPVGSSGRVHGDILCTGLSSFEFPFIRYAVGDSAVWENPHISCKCGRKSRIIHQIEGRDDDYVITPEGQRVMRFDYIFKDTQEIKECQILQKELGAITVKIVKRDAYSISNENYIAGEIAKWISPKLRVDFEYVREIERERNGKFRAVKTLLK